VFLCAATATSPLCDRHHVPMAFAAYEDNGFAIAGYAYLCWQAGCCRWYDPALGYFDLVEGTRATLPAPVTCPAHDVPMYEGHFDFVAEAAHLRCPRAYCPHSSVQLTP
jgi:hypothetical protein